MVPFEHNANIPLLPYEKQLIEALGCTEEEYCSFIRELRRKEYIRPAAYDGIPDIRMEPTAIILFFVGLALNAASYFLTPKPSVNTGRDKGIRQQQLGGVESIANFSPTQGFESVQDLATYGSVVPIVFTKREDHGDFSTGGLLISPSLVWSRLKSWGRFQVLEIVGIAGQGNMAKPDRAGIFLGNNALDGIFDDQFQFYWNGGFEVTGTNSRLRGANLRYGSLFVPAPPAATEDAFICPTSAGSADNGFCGAFTPSNQTRFGVYAAIPNGTPYRPNWEIIPVLEGSDADSYNQQITNQQKFIPSYLREQHPYGGGTGSGGNPYKSGMPGTGVNYARHVGVVSHNGYVVPAAATTVDAYGVRVTGSYTAERYVAKGDTIEVYIGYGRQNIEPFSPFGGSVPVRLDDVQSALDSEAVEYDRAFNAGAIFMIGRSVWQVIERPNRAYTPGEEHITVKLKCLEAWSNAQNKIGLVNKDAIFNPSFLPYGGDIDETWYPICKVELANIRNTRPCDVTELGIKSQVWARFNGITNFNTVPNPFTLQSYNLKRVQVREGKNTSYAKRVSFFALDIRPANSEPFRDYNKNEGFVNVASFAVSGSTPQDLFSFIRIKHPVQSMYEYRLRPFNSAVLSQQGDGNYDVFELDGGVTPFQEFSVDTYMGTFTIGGRGRFIRPRDYYTHSQMVAKPELIGTLVYGEWVPSTPKLELTGVFSNTDNRSADSFKISNLWSYFLQVNGHADYDPYFANLPNGYTKTFTGWDYGRDLPAKGVYMRVTLRSYQQSRAGTPRNKWWQTVSTEVVNIIGTWPDGSTFSKNQVDILGEQWRFVYRTIATTVYQEFPQPRSATRTWETYSGIAEVSHYGDLITRSCDSGPEHEVIYVNESLAEDRLVEYKNCAVVGLKLQSSNNFTSLDQLRCYLHNGLEVERLTDGGTGSSNLFTDLFWYLATNTSTGAGNIINSSLIDRNQLAETGRYLRANDLYFDDVIADPINLRSWLTEKAPSMLCFLAISNGKLSINPALPTDSSRVIANVPPVISAMFTDGNILEDSLSVEWLDLEERKMFQAAIIYKRSPVNKLPQQETIIVRYNEANADSLPLEEFSLPHITSEKHALTAAKYFLAVRKHITHTITFKTLPYGVSLAPGQFIRVAVEQSPYNPANNGIIKEDGTVVSVTPVTDGSYDVFYWDRTQTVISEGTLRITDGIAQNLRNTVFSVKNSQTSSQVYQVEAIDLDQEGIATVKASSFPVDSQGRSLIAADVASTTTFEVIGQDVG